MAFCCPFDFVKTHFYVINSLRFIAQRLVEGVTSECLLSVFSLKSGIRSEGLKGLFYSFNNLVMIVDA